MIDASHSVYNNTCDPCMPNMIWLGVIESAMTSKFAQTFYTILLHTTIQLRFILVTGCTDFFFLSFSFGLIALHFLFLWM